MKSKLSAKIRLSLIKRSLKGESITKLAKEAGTSRTIFYRWLKRYKEKGKLGLHPQKAGRPRLREASASQSKKTSYIKLSPSTRLKMVEEVVQQGSSPTDVAGKYEVSRVTLYKWINRYKKAAEGQKWEAMEVKTRKKTVRYFRQTPQTIERKIIDLVVGHPEYGVRRLLKVVPKIEGRPAVGHHGIQNVLRRNKLNTYVLRFAYASAQKQAFAPKPRFAFIWERIKLVWEQFVPNLAPAPPPKVKRLFKPFLLSSLLTFLFSFVVLTWIRLISQSTSPSQSIGFIFSTTALLMGSIFFAYSLKYYITLAIVLSYSQAEEKRGYKKSKRRGFISWLLGSVRDSRVQSQKSDKTIGLEPNLEHISLKRHPFISVQVPLFNEKYVVKRLIKAATNLEYKGQYEVILCDDSTDETTEIIKSYQKSFGNLRTSSGNGYTLTECKVRPGVSLKHLHRTSRLGFKGGALKLALSLVDPKTEFISVFDADFVPYPDTLELFLKYFQATAGSLDFRPQTSDVRKDNQKSKIKDQRSNIAAVQGYQWHVLNKSENWITRGVRSEYAGSYVIERSGEEIYGGLKQISGAVYMIRRDALEEVGWETSITEDFELTLKLYEKGYKVVYTPYIQAPAECVSTLQRLIRQRMRWSEGHSHNVKKMFSRLMLSNNLTSTEKLETLYLSPYYLQAFFFLVGTLAWVISETLFQTRLPFWTSLWGWSLVLTNLLALPLMNSVGLFLEESEEKDYAGILSFIALTYILVPFQAYASIKGFLEKEEGPWFRTPKTGKITDVFTRGRFYRFISGILPGRTSRQPPAIAQISTQYLSLATANSKFDSFNIRPKRKRWLGKVALAVLLLVSMNLVYFSQGVTLVQASPGTQVKTIEYYLYQYGGAPSTLISSGEGMDGNAYDSTYPSTVTINLPETSITIRRAIVQWTSNIQQKSADLTDSDWVFDRDSGTQTITDNDDVEFGDAIDGGAKVAHTFTRYIDVTSAVQSGSHTYSFDAQYTGDDRTNDSAKIYITYEYDDSSATQLKTVRYFVGCDESREVTDTATDFDSDDFDTYTVNPGLDEGSFSINSHWIELNAVKSDTGDKIDGQFRIDYTGDDPEEIGNASWVDTGEKYEENFFMMEELGVSNINLTSDNTIKLGFTTAQSGSTTAVHAMCGEWVLTYSFDFYSSSGSEETHTRTVRYFMGAIAGCGSGDCNLPTSQTTVGQQNIYIPEDGVAGNFKSVWVRYHSAYDADGNFTPEVDITSDTSTGTAFVFDTLTKNIGSAFMQFDVTSHFNSFWSNGEQVTVKAASSAASSHMMVWAELIITYEFNSETNTSDDIKTVFWWVENAVQGQASNFDEGDVAWTNDFDTFIPESGTLTWRSSAVIARFHRGNNSGMNATARTHTVTINSTESGTDTQAAAGIGDLKTSNFTWLGVLTDTQMNPATLANQTNIAFTVSLDDYTTTATTEILPSLYAYTTYQFDGPEVPEAVIVVVGLVFIIPAVVRWVKKRRRWDQDIGPPKLSFVLRPYFTHLPRGPDPPS